MAKVNKTALHDFVTGEFVREEHLDQNFEVLRVAINDTDARIDTLTQNVSQVEDHADLLQVSLNNLTASHNTLSQQFSNYRIQVNQQFIDVQAQFDQQITDLQLQYTYLENNKADRTYVEQLLADVQAGQLVPGTIKTEHIADGSITAAKVDGVSVLTAQQIDQRIAQISWDTLQNKPSQFPPGPHTHQGIDIQGAVPDSDKLGGYAASNYPRLNVINTFTQRQTFAGGITDGDSNTDVSLINSVQHQVHTRSTVLTYTNGRLTKVEEKHGSTVVKTTTLNYGGNGRLSSVVETAGGVPRTSTLNYDANGNLISVTRA